MFTSGPELDQEACWRAVRTRDARFDGRFFTCVKTTGIYCRPVCPARTPLRQNVIFVPTAAAAEERGFRACLRCRPETAPEMGAWNGTSNTVSRALALIEAGALDDGDVDALAGRLGVGERQLRRLFRKHLGAAPVSVAQTRRVLLAKALIQEGDLPMAQVALAAGFGSVRRFNETFQALYGRPPSALRRRAERAWDGGVRIGLPYREPHDWDALLAALTARGDEVEGGVWTRPLVREVDGATGWVRVERSGARTSRSATAARRGPGGPRSLAAVSVEVDDLRTIPGVLARVRRTFDLGCDPQAVARDLSADPVLAPLVAARPGLRLAGAWIDAGEDAPSDRMDVAGLEMRAEGWRPWRAYALAHLRAAGIDPRDLIEETRDAA